MRILGIDYGDRTIGIAVSDEMGWTAQGVEVIRRGHFDRDMGRLKQLIEQYEVAEIVVGLPRNMNGTVGPRGEMCKQFADELQQATSLPVHLWDERLTTVAAERTLLEADVSRKKR